jgi:hypothetical protein
MWPGRTICVQCTKFLDSAWKQVRVHKSVTTEVVMPSVAVPTSSLPSLMMPCPVCAGRMVYHGQRPVGPELEDTVYACRSCGGELVRTSLRGRPGAEKRKSAA